jgi:hypothetical protein
MIVDSHALNPQLTPSARIDAGNFERCGTLIASDSATTIAVMVVFLCTVVASTVMLTMPSIVWCSLVHRVSRVVLFVSDCLPQVALVRTAHDESHSAICKVGAPDPKKVATDLGSGIVSRPW